VAKLRDEQRFDSLQALTEQMDRDADEARQILTAQIDQAELTSRQD